jgi:hypothetical protein
VEVVGNPTLSVNPSQLYSGQAVTVALTYGPGLPGDWIGLFPVGGTQAQRIWSQYVNIKGPTAAGVSAASFTVASPIAPGVYEFRLYRNDSWTLLTTSPAVTVTAPAVSVSATQVATGQVVTATVTNGPGLPGDWLAFFPVGGGQAQRIWSQYLNGKGPSAPGVSTAMLSVTMPTAPGTYEFRLYRNDSWTLLTTSPVITVTAPAVSVSATQVATGQVVTATVTNGPGLPGDWLAFFPVGGGQAQRIWSQYLNGKGPSGPGVSMATLPLTMPTTPGTYELRLYRNDSWTLLATSPAITVTAASIDLSAASVSAGTELSVTVENGPGLPGDWVGLFPVGGTSAQRVTAYYVNGTGPAAPGVTGGTRKLLMPSPGTFEFRLYRNDSWTLLATSPPITVVAPAPQPTPSVPHSNN